MQKNRDKSLDLFLFTYILTLLVVFFTPHQTNLHTGRFYAYRNISAFFGVSFSVSFNSCFKSVSSAFPLFAASGKCLIKLFVSVNEYSLFCGSYHDGTAKCFKSVIPAKAGIYNILYLLKLQIPAFARMTDVV